MNPIVVIIFVSLAASVAEDVTPDPVDGDPTEKSNAITDEVPSTNDTDSPSERNESSKTKSLGPQQKQQQEQQQPPPPAPYPYIQMSTIPNPYEPRYFTERTKSDMTEFFDRASRDIDLAESQISLSTELARKSVANDMNESKNFVIKYHESQLNEAVQHVIDENYLWECAKKGEKLIASKARILADRINDCIKRASKLAMDVVTSAKSHVAEDKARRMQKFNEDIPRLNSCTRELERHCLREQINLIERNVIGLASDARNEVERVKEASRQQISDFSVCRRFQDDCYLQLLTESDKIVERCIQNSYLITNPRQKI